MRIVLLGAPGSGKGTQAKLMAETYRVPQVSTGDLLRKAVADKTEVGKKIAAILDAGELVSDDIVIDAVTDQVRSPDSRRGFVLDGFPRNIPQAQELDTRLGWMGRPVQLVLHLALSEDLVVKRITGRLTCNKCGAIYNKHFSPPKKRATCDQCGGKKLTHRSDDNEKTIRSRLVTFDRDTMPLIGYYRAQHKLRTIPADGDIDKIFASICEVVDTEIRPMERKIVSISEPVMILRVKKPQPEKESAAKKTSKGSAGKSEKPAPKAAKKKAAKKKAAKKKVAKAVAKKTAKKSTAKKAAKKVSKKVSKKVAKKVAKKVTKKSPAKKTVGKKAPAKKVSKKTAKKVTKKAPTAKTGKKIGAAKKTARKAGKKSTSRRR